MLIPAIRPTAVLTPKGELIVCPCFGVRLSSVTIFKDQPLKLLLFIDSGIYDIFFFTFIIIFFFIYFIFIYSFIYLFIFFFCACWKKKFIVEWKYFLTESICKIDERFHTMLGSFHYIMWFIVNLWFFWQIPKYELILCLKSRLTGPSFWR